MTQPISVGEVLSINNASVSCQQWRELLTSNCSEIAVDLSRVREVDTAGLQLLVALKLEAASRGKTLSFSGQTDLLKKQATLLGLSSLLLGS